MEIRAWIMEEVGVSRTFGIILEVGIVGWTARSKNSCLNQDRRIAHSDVNQIRDARVRVARQNC